MSAYILSSNHIDALIHVALFGPIDAANWHAPSFSNPSRTLDVFTADKLGAELEREMYASVSARYPTRENGTPSPYKFPHTLFTVRPFLTTVAALKLLQCYEYQSCEHGDWKASATRRFCDHLKDALIMQLPGYDAAPWDI